MSGADAAKGSRHSLAMLGHSELIAELERRKAAGETTNAKLGRVLSLPTSRIAEIFKGTRLIRVDEMKLLVEAFGLERPEDEAALLAPAPSNLEPILDALIPLSPPGKLTDQSRKALAEALSYGLGLLGSSIANPANSDALDVAARAAVARFRERAIA